MPERNSDRPPRCCAVVFYVQVTPRKRVLEYVAAAISKAIMSNVLLGGVPMVVEVLSSIGL